MIELNLKKPFLDLDGNVSEGDDMGKVLARALMIGNEGDPCQMMDWALFFHRGETVQLDSSGFDKLKGYIENSKSLVNFAKGRLLQEMKAAKNGD